VSYLKEYFEDMEAYRSKITDNMKSIDNIKRIFKGMASYMSFKTLMSIQ
jgi:hypothetical protein